MKEYTILAMASVLLTFFLDRFTKINLLKKREFFLFLVIILIFKLIVNGFLTGKGIVMYNPSFFLGTRIGSIPWEDFLFGFSMVTMSIIFWELFKKDN